MCVYDRRMVIHEKAVCVNSKLQPLSRNKISCTGRAPKELSGSTIRCISLLVLSHILALLLQRSIMLSDFHRLFREVLPEWPPWYLRNKIRQLAWRRYIFLEIGSVTSNCICHIEFFIWDASFVIGVVYFRCPRFCSHIHLYFACAVFYLS